MKHDYWLVFDLCVLYICKPEIVNKKQFWVYMPYKCCKSQNNLMRYYCLTKSKISFINIIKLYLNYDQINVVFWLKNHKNSTWRKVFCIWWFKRHECLIIFGQNSKPTAIVTIRNSVPPTIPKGTLLCLCSYISVCLLFT